MKKIKMFLFMVILFFSWNTMATSGVIRQDSIVECNNKFYGNHGSPLHWHLVEKKNNKWVSVSGEVAIPSCYIKPVNKMEKVLFSKCSDGDTAHFIINGEEKIVRFLAIDTPEVNHPEKGSEMYGKEASEYTCNALTTAKEIYLEYDSNSDKEDKYGRILAFVHVDGVLLEKNIVEQGLARVYYIYGDYNHVEELKEIEKEAQKQKIGIWSDFELPDISTSDADNTIQDEKNQQDNESVIVRILKLIFEILENIFDLFFK